MPRIFILGSEQRLVEATSSGDVNGYTSNEIHCNPSNREVEANQYLEAASALNREEQIIAADYGPNPDGTAITVTLYYYTPNL